MRDPHPENIGGRKVHEHVWKHEIQWAYVVLGLLALVVLLKFGGPILGSVDDDDDQGESGASFSVAG